MTTAEWIGIVGLILSTLAAVIEALIFLLYRDAVRRIAVLEDQNRVQGLDLAGLRQKVDDAGRHDDQVLKRFDKLDEKIDDLTKDVASLMRRGPSGGGYGGSGAGRYSAGEMPAVRPPR